MSTVLIVDDEKMFSEMLARFLSLNGFKTLCAKDSTEAFGTLDTKVVDAVLLDINLGQENGFALLDPIRKTHPVPVIMLTGLGYDEGAMQEALKVGAAGYLSKMVEMEEVVLTLHRVVGANVAKAL